MSGLDLCALPCLFHRLIRCSKGLPAGLRYSEILNRRGLQLNHPDCFSGKNEPTHGRQVLTYTLQ